MAKAKKLPSGSWRCQVYDFTDENGKRHYQSFTALTRRDAELQAANYAANRSDALSIENIKFGQALAKYISLKELVLSPSTIREYKRASKNYSDIAGIRIADITQDDIQVHTNIFSATHSPKSTRDNHGLLSAVIRMFRPGFAINTTLPAKTKPTMYVPNDNDIKRVMQQVAGTEMEIPVLLAAFGPMRRGEICALNSDSINGACVHVRRNMVQNDKLEWVIKDPKSYEGDRFITYPAFVAEKLKDIDGSVTDLNPNMITSRFNHILINAGVPHFRFHDLRHYCASILHAINVPDAYIMERGGWGDDGVLKNVYRHVMDERKEAESKKANDHFEKMQHEMQHENK